MRIVYDPNALEDTDERLFPHSRHRSSRILKKLIRRHGGTYRKQPCIFRCPEMIIAHPSFKAEIERKTQPADNYYGYNLYAGFLR
jgi:hypothetical protein